MNDIDESGYVKVAIGGDVVRRRAELSVIGRRTGGDLVVVARPELREGEILCERLGMIPTILRAQ